MSLYSPLFFLATVAVLLGLVALPCFADADVPPTKVGRRVSTLDGARGFLALAVFVHHGVIYYAYLRTGAWEPPPSRFYAMLGQVGVALFFMITGYLFWFKLLRERGRPRWGLLYLGRVFRIGPLYVAAVLTSFVVIFAHSGWSLHGTLFGAVKSALVWLALGIVGPGGDINHYARTTHVLAGVTWTLQYEWWFYAALLPLSVAARAPALAACAPLVAFLGLCCADAMLAPAGATAPPLVCACFFAAGMAVASLHRSGRVPPAGHASSAVALALLTAILASCADANGAIAVAALSIVFLIVAGGSDLFGLLSLRASARLGDMSYSIYLLHGLVLDAVFSSPSVVRFALGSTGAWWLVLLAIGAALVVLSTITLVVIERPGVALGRRAGDALTSSVQELRSALRASG